MPMYWTLGFNSFSRRVVPMNVPLVPGLHAIGTREIVSLARRLEAESVYATSS